MSTNKPTNHSILNILKNAMGMRNHREAENIRTLTS